jgi:hypothetical protein
MPISNMYVLGGVKISAKKANELMAVAAIKKECERVWYTCPRFSGMPDSRIDEARAAFGEAVARLAAFDSVLVADCYQGCQAGNSSKPVWASPAHLLGL